MRPKIPFTVTILIAIVLTFTAINAVRFIAALDQWDVLTMLEVSPNPLYIALTGVFWAVTGLGLAFGLAAGHPMARWAGLVLVPLYACYYWFERLVLQNAVPRENTVFALVVTILVVFYTYLALLLPSATKFFIKRSYG